ncbi:MAG: oleate hydratase [Faecalimonas sp.]
MWVYGLFTDVPGDYREETYAKDCTGKEITEEWLYHIGVPVENRFLNWQNRVRSVFRR